MSEIVSLRKKKCLAERDFFNTRSSWDRTESSLFPGILLELLYFHWLSSPSSVEWQGILKRFIPSHVITWHERDILETYNFAFIYPLYNSLFSNSIYERLYYTPDT